MPKTRNLCGKVTMQTETDNERIIRICGKQNMIEVAEELESLRAHNKLMQDAIRLAERQLCEVELCAGTRRILLGSLKRKQFNDNTN
jgi:hypothetical protein